MDWNKFAQNAIALCVFFGCIGAIAAGIDSEFKAIAGLTAGFLIGKNISIGGNKDA
jgi:hypothetical protein